MTFERVEENGIVYDRVVIDGFRCAFSTRIGGVSRGVCESLNLGLTKKDTHENVDRNRAKFAETVGFQKPKLLRQVHGSQVIDIPAEESEGIQEADALVTGTAGRALGVLTADCVPVALWDMRARCVGIAHAGRLGTVRDVVTATLEKMVVCYGAEASGVMAFIGPSIGPDAYEVGENAMKEVRAGFPKWRDFTVSLGGGKSLLDLWGMNRASLEEAGVPSDRIFTAGYCTQSNAREFFSYRREGPGVGRMMNVVWME